jgi:hypothetical protein
MKKFINKFLKVINEAKKKNYLKQITTLEEGLAKIDLFLKTAKVNDPYLNKFLDMKNQFEFQLKIYTEPVSVICYGETRNFTSAADAMDYFNERIKVL